MKTFDAFMAVSYGPACIERSEYRQTIEALIDLASTAHLAVYAAPAEEKWGRLLTTRKEAIGLDHAAMQICPAFVYFTGGFESDGALVELGMALALQKHVLVVRYAKEELLSHVRGLIDIGLAHEVIIGQEDDLRMVIEWIDIRCSSIEYATAVS